MEAFVKSRQGMPCSQAELRFMSRPRTLISFRHGSLWFRSIRRLRQPRPTISKNPLRNAFFCWTGCWLWSTIPLWMGCCSVVVLSCCSISAWAPSKTRSNGRQKGVPSVLVGCLFVEGDGDERGNMPTDIYCNGVSD